MAGRITFRAKRPAPRRSGASFMTAVKVFIDYQNAYMRARELFGSSGTDHFRVGQFDPRGLGLLLTQLGHGIDPARELAEVRVYRGEPDARRSPTGQAACRTSSSTKGGTAWGCKSLISSCPATSGRSR